MHRSYWGGVERSTLKLKLAVWVARVAGRIVGAALRQLLKRRAR